MCNTNRRSIKVSKYDYLNIPLCMKVYTISTYSFRYLTIQLIYCNKTIFYFKALHIYNKHVKHGYETDLLNSF